MTARKLITTVALILGLAAPSALLAQGPNGPCILAKHRVTSVRPYKVQEALGRSFVTRVRGADVYVQAEPGLTAEWLRHEINDHVAHMQHMQMKDCAFGINNLDVQVDSAGAGFSVKLIGHSDTDSNEILRRAQTLVGG